MNTIILKRRRTLPFSRNQESKRVEIRNQNDKVFDRYVPVKLNNYLSYLYYVLQQQTFHWTLKLSAENVTSGPPF